MGPSLPPIVGRAPVTCQNLPAGFVPVADSREPRQLGRGPPGPATVTSLGLSQCREPEIHTPMTRIQPPLRHSLSPREEVHAVRAIRVRVAEQRSLPAPIGRASCR